jgi:VWFA-related protein
VSGQAGLWRWAAILLLVPGGAVMPVGWVRAQQTPAQLDVAGVQVEEGQLTLSVAVLDSGSNPVAGLDVGAFRVTIDGAAVAPGAVSSGLDAALPLGIILAVDTSGSMQGQPLQSARQAILPLVRAMQASDQAALLTFAQSVSVPLPLTGDTARLAAGIDAMVATGNTALFAGTARAAELAAAAPQPRRVVVLLSDGEDFGSASGGITREQALAAAQSAGVPFFVVGLGQEVDQQFLTSLASTTNGQYFAATDPTQLSGLYARISDRLRQQYTVVVPLPAELAGGSHRVTVTAGGVTGAASFQTAGPPPRGIELDTLPAELDRETVVSVSGGPTGGIVSFALDGQAVGPLAAGRSVRLDPYVLDPAAPHTLTVTVGGETISRTFRVAALPPVLVAPREVPNLRPGDLLRLTITAQPGPLAVSLFVDGEAVETLQAPPFEFIIPERDFAPGEHQARVVISNASGTVEEAYGFTIPGEPGPNYAAYALLALAAVAMLGGIAYGGWRAFSWYRARPRPLDVSGVGEQLAEWAELRRGGHTGETPAPPPGDAPGPWGRLTVAKGPDAGRVFELRDDVELVGRGSFCSVRLSDPGVEPAHFVISRDGRLNASTPTARVEVDGRVVRSGLMGRDPHIRIGSTELLLEGPGWLQD